MLPGIGMTEMVVLGIIAVLLFGERLPEMARKVGAYYTDFRKGLSNIQSEMNSITREVNSVGSSTSYTSRKTTTTTTSGPSADDYDEATAPKFEPPPAPPTPSGE